jgi:hypothetical protein
MTPFLYLSSFLEKTREAKEQAQLCAKLAV